MNSDTSDKTIHSEQKYFYEIRAKKVIKNLERRAMNGCFVPNRQEALKLAMSLITQDAVVGCGDSVTLNQIGIIQALQERGQSKIINPFSPDEKGHHPPREVRRKLQREALLSDVFLTSANAVTLDGRLVCIDAAGNRVAAMIFGPRRVIAIVGGNKIVTNVDEGLNRIRNEVAPLNSIRHFMKHQHPEAIDRPCVKEGKCIDCFHEWRICRFTVVFDGNQPWEKGRTTVILVGEELGI